jgi:hypothetical protein
MTRRFPVLLARLLLLAVVVACGACSSFDAKWRAAEKAAGPNGPTRWDGRWTSEKHRGKSGEPEGGRLRAVLTPVVATAPAAGVGPLRADFRANWLTFAASYTMTLTPVPGSRTDFRGTHELPAIFGGTYRYTARLIGDRLTATYDSSYDRGTFDLTRVRP